MDKSIEKGMEVIEELAKDEIMSNKIVRKIPDARRFIDGNIGKYIVFIVIFLVLYTWFINIVYYFIKRAVMKKITLNNVMKFYKILCFFGVSIQNHPKVWNELRTIFYNINKSELIPTELKKKLKVKLEKKGLVISRITIIDNYKTEIMK